MIFTAPRDYGPGPYDVKFRRSQSRSEEFAVNITADPAKLYTGNKLINFSVILPPFPPSIPYCPVPCDPATSEVVIEDNECKYVMQFEIKLIMLCMWFCM